MRPHLGLQQQHHQPQQYGAQDNCLKQQQQQHQNFLKTQHQQQQQQYQQNYQHQPQQQHPFQPHALNHALQQQSTVPPPRMWNHHQLATACYGSAGSTQTLAPTNSHPTAPGTAMSVNLQPCRAYPSNRPYQQQHATHTVPHYANTNGFGAHQTAERMAFPTATPNYAKLPPLSVVNQQRINECAGIPLISTATAHLTPGQRQRISRKQSHSPPGKNWANMMGSNSAANYAQYAAAHAQGAPLMLQKQQQQQQQQQHKNEYWPQPNFASKPSALQYNRSQDRTRTPLRYQNSAPAALTSDKSKENLDLQLKDCGKDSENGCSSNGDTTSNSNETCLPRIIKPRKRRKKDRKPVNSLANAVYLKLDTKAYQDKSAAKLTEHLKHYKSSEDLMQKFSQLKCYQAKNHHGLNNTLISGKPELNSFNISQCLNATKDVVKQGVCFCNECDPLRSIWDYPLRRSLSDSSSTSESSGTGSLSDNTTTSNDSNWPKSRAEIVGVIGSKRNKEHQNRSSSTKPNDTRDNSASFGHNILSGLNFPGELFKYNNSTDFINFENPLTCSDGMVLLPETAETLLTRSINEISQKLIETCSNESCDFPLSSCNSLSSFSTTSSNSSSANSTCAADFSSNDSGIESAHINAGDDLVFNFDHLHITTKATKMTSSSSASSSSSSSSTSSSSCGNISMSSSPTVKFATNFLTTPTPTPALTLGITGEGTAATPSTGRGLTSPTIKATPLASAPTLDFLLDLNNNHLHAAPTTIITTTTSAPLTIATAKAMINASGNNQKQKQQQFNELTQNHQPPHPHQQQQQQQTPTSLQQQHEQQFFNNCFDLMWQQHERQLTNINTNTNTNTITTTNPPHIEPIISSSTSTALLSNNVAMSSFLDSVGSLKTVFSTIS